MVDTICMGAILFIAMCYVLGILSALFRKRED